MNVCGTTCALNKVPDINNICEYCDSSCTVG